MSFSKERLDELVEKHQISLVSDRKGNILVANFRNKRSGQKRTLKRPRFPIGALEAIDLMEGLELDE